MGGSLYDIITKGDHWPFSSYPMFAKVQREYSAVTLGAFGVTEDRREIPLRDFSFIAPFDQCRLRIAFDHMKQQKEQARLEVALQDCLMRYESRRLAGQHQGPRILEAKLYQLEWQLYSPRNHSKRKLIAETKR
jgi:hypothetical protein